MFPRLIIAIFLSAPAGLRAGWGFTFKLAQSGPCPAVVTGNFSLPPVNNMPTQSQCESLRAQILGIKQCTAIYASSSPYNYLGQCCVFYTCTPCSGFDDPKNGAGSAGGSFSSGGAAGGQPFFARSANTQNLDWEKQTQDRIRVLSGQMEDLFASLKAPSSGDATFDAGYREEMAKSYAKKQPAVGNDDATPRIGGGGGDAGESGESEFFYKLQMRQTGPGGAGITGEERYRGKLMKMETDASGAASVGGAGMAKAGEEAGENEGASDKDPRDYILKESGKAVASQAWDKVKEEADELAGVEVFGTLEKGKIVKKVLEGDYAGAAKDSLDMVVGGLTMTSGMALEGGRIVGGVAKEATINAFEKMNAAVGVPPGKGKEFYEDTIKSLPPPAKFVANFVGMGEEEK